MRKIKSCWNSINILEKILVILGFTVVAKLCLDKLVFHHTILNKIGNMSVNFFLVTLFVNVFLIGVIYRTFKTCNIQFKKKDYIALGLLIGVTYAVYIFSIIHRYFLYYQDYTVYYQLQTMLEETFINSNLIVACKSVVSSVWYADYANFLSLFLQASFQFTNKTLDSFVISEVLIIIPYLYVCLLALIKNILKKDKSKLAYLLMIVAVLVPLLHTNLVLGMPDVFGLVFVSLIILLTIDYDFKKLDILRLVLLGISTLFLIISRRWYLYWALSYYVLYVVKLIAVPIINKDYKSLKKIIINGLKFGIIFGGITCVLLFPMIKRILFTNYSKNYAFYKKGGVIYELVSQVKRFGLISVVLSLLGYLLSIRKDDNRKYLLLLLNFFFIIFLFNRVQSFSDHHSLMLIYTIIFGLWLLITKLFNKKQNILICVVMVALSFNFIYSVNNKLKDNIFFTNVSVNIEKRKDVQGIKKVSKWIYDNTDKDNTAYMINHSFVYNPDIFKYANSDKVISYEALPYGSAILGSHKFPLRLFDAKYIITCDPFTGYSISSEYNKAFLNSPYFEKRFKEIKTFDMKNGYIFYVYERVEKVDIYEINYYKDYFKKESKKYPYLYEEIIDDYIKNNL